MLKHHIPLGNLIDFERNSPSFVCHLPYTRMFPYAGMGEITFAIMENIIHKYGPNAQENTNGSNKNSAVDGRGF